MPHPFKVQFLDHVALRVKDLERAAQWYADVLGLERYQPEEWKPWPIFMVAGESGVALFPERAGHVRVVEHFAFRVDQQSFDDARQWFEVQGITYEYQDHVYFDSIYVRDPDGHVVELTTPK